MDMPELASGGSEVDIPELTGGGTEVDMSGMILVRMVPAGAFAIEEVSPPTGSAEACCFPIYFPI